MAFAKLFTVLVVVYGSALLASTEALKETNSVFRISPRMDVSVNANCTAKVDSLVFGGAQPMTLTCNGMGTNGSQSIKDLTEVVANGLIKVTELFGQRQLNITLKVNGFTENSVLRSQFIWSETLVYPIEPSRIVLVEVNNIHLYLGDARNGCAVVPQNVNLRIVEHVLLHTCGLVLPVYTNQQSTV